MLYVSIINNIPLIIVGAPGSCKTLSVNLMNEILKNTKFHNRIYNDLVNIYENRNINLQSNNSLSVSFYGYQCQTHTTTNDLEKIFELGENNQNKFGNNGIVVIYLEEM